MTRIAVLGTGIMGGPIARNLLQAGHDVTVWNRTREKTATLAAAGAVVADTPAAAVTEADIVLTMLADADAVTAVMVDGGAIDAVRAGSLWIQTSTVGLAATQQLEAAADAAGVPFVDAPVLGTRKPAEDAQLVVLASGPDAARGRCEALFDVIARSYVWLGEAGMGTRLKLVVNSWILCTIENVSETFALAQELGLDPRRFLEAISGGGIDMQYAHLKGEAILNEQFPPSFPLRLARKDVALILDAAGELELPLVWATLRQFDRALELGHGDDDMSAVYYASATAARTRS
jgi:3-hydroxyisobutyrate dehydrogenase